MSRLPMADRRDQLVAAALTIAARDGIEAATVRAVALEAGVSAGVVHYCFSDKNELLTCMAEEITRLNTPDVLGDATGSAGEDGAESDNAVADLPDGSTEDPAPPPGAQDGDEQSEDGPDAGPEPASEQPPAGLPGQEPVPIDVVLTELVGAMWKSLEETPGYQLLTYELTVTALRSAELDGVAQAQYRAGHAAAAGILEYAGHLADITWSRPVEDLARIVVAAIDGAALGWLVDKDSDAAQRILLSTVELLSSYARQ